MDKSGLLIPAIALVGGLALLPTIAFFVTVFLRVIQGKSLVEWRTRPLGLRKSSAIVLLYLCAFLSSAGLLAYVLTGDVPAIIAIGSIALIIFVVELFVFRKWGPELPEKGFANEAAYQAYLNGLADWNGVMLKKTFVPLLVFLGICMVGAVLASIALAIVAILGKFN